MLNIGINGRSLFRQITGVQHYALEISRSLSALQDENLQVTIFSGREGRSRSETNMPVSASLFPASGPLRGVFWEQALLRRMVRKSGVDALFNPANVAPLFPGVTNIVTIHDLAFLLFPGFFSDSFSRYYREAVPRIAARADAIITVSNSSREDILRYLPVRPEKVSVVHQGVSKRFNLKPSEDELEKVRVTYGLPHRFFLSISSLEPRKNLRMLVRSYGLLPEDTREEFGLVLTGTGGRIFADDGVGQEISGLADSQVITTGYIPAEDLVTIYHLATALVYPSLYEGFGLPVLEAMAASTPVITSNRSSIPEVAGNAALLVDPEDAEELAGAMELLANDSGTRNLLIERGRKRCAGFTWENTARKTLEIIRAATE